MTRKDLLKMGISLICTVLVSSCSYITQQKLSSKYPQKEMFPITDNLDMAFVKIHKGSFMMGSPERTSKKLMDLSI